MKAQRIVRTTLNNIRSNRYNFCSSVKLEDAPKKSPIYTRTGDKGTSMLFNGERRSKSDLCFNALGNQDELNAVIGIAREYCTNVNEASNIVDMLFEIQCRIFDIGAHVATPASNSSDSKKQLTKFDMRHTQRVEKWIDELDSKVHPLKNFVIPAGGQASLHLNLARTVCRRAERSVVDLVQLGEVDEEVGRYLNRLSDFLFVASRFASKQDGRSETIWRKADFPSDAV